MPSPPRRESTQPCLSRRTLQNGESAQAGILHADNIETGFAPQYSMPNIVVEIFIGDKQKHGYLFLRASNRARILLWSKYFSASSWRCR